MIALVQPPYFRVMGSHNDKLAPSLLFLGSKLKAKGQDVVIVNTDAGTSSYYIPWHKLYDNFKYYEEAVLRGSPVIYEAFEKVMQYQPEIVILEAGDILEATVDIGSPFIAMHLVRLLQEEKVKVFGIGPLWHESSFDIKIWQESVLPLVSPDFTLVPRDSKYDTVFTKLGCPYRCLFCLQPKYTGRWEKVPKNLIKDQLRLERHYIEDPVFDPDPEVIDLLHGRRYICETRVDKINEDWVERAKQCGVEMAKLGVESGSEEFIIKTNKRISQNGTKVAIQLLKKAGIKIVVYVLLGWYGVSEKVYWQGLNYFRELEADYYVINITCPYGRNGRDWRFDTHFSPRTAGFWGLPESLIRAYYELQEGKVNPSLI